MYPRKYFYERTSTHVQIIWSTSTRELAAFMDTTSIKTFGKQLLKYLSVKESHEMSKTVRASDGAYRCFAHMLSRKVASCCSNDMMAGVLYLL